VHFQRRRCVALMRRGFAVASRADTRFSFPKKSLDALCRLQRRFRQGVAHLLPTTEPGAGDAQVIPHTGRCCASVVDNTWTAHGHFASVQVSKATPSPWQTSAWRQTQRSDANEPTRNGETTSEAASQDGAQTRRSRVQDATTIAAGAAHLSKCRDALRPGDITLIMRRAQRRMK
jgi:hypothetical protein